MNSFDEEKKNSGMKKEKKKRKAKKNEIELIDGIYGKNGLIFFTRLVRFRTFVCKERCGFLHWSADRKK